MSNELARRETDDQSFIDKLIVKAENLEQIKEVGMVIIKSGFCPVHFQTSQDAVGAIMCIDAGRKLGLSWMQSLSDIYPVKGRIGIMGTAAKAVIFASGILESWEEITEGIYPNSDYKHITISKRKDLPTKFRTEFSVFDAQTAGLMQKEIYRKYGKRMIAWRDIGFHASDYYQDILKGMKTVEELNDFDLIQPVQPDPLVKTIKTEAGDVITDFSDVAKGKSMTQKATDKINAEKFEPIDKKANIQDAEAIHKEEEDPPIAQRGSSESMNGKEILREDNNTDNEPELKEGQWPLKQMEEMPTEKLLTRVNDDMDMMEAMQIIPGKNTNRKLRDIIWAHQRGTLAEYVAPHIVDDSNKEAPQSQEMAPNKEFDNQAGGEAVQTNIDILAQEKKNPDAMAGNKHNIEVPPFDKGEEREFSTMKGLFNSLAGVGIDNSKWLALNEQINGAGAKYKSREEFARYATVEEVNEFLNAK